MKITFNLNITPFEIVRDAVAAGVARGFNRAYKHTEAPTDDDIKCAIVDAVMGDLCDTLDFDSYREEREDGE